MKSLKATNSDLADGFVQLEVLNKTGENQRNIEKFSSKLDKLGLLPLKPISIEVLQVNVGKMCNQVCKHCHVDAGPDRKEIMTTETMEKILSILQNTPEISTVDLTGGAPEMNPNFRWFVKGISDLGKHIIVRCNLTIILANPKYNDLPEFFKKHKIEVVSSLPYFSARRTDSQRGDGVFEKSIKALQMLNAVGYGMKETDLSLNLVYNPSGAFLPSDQASLEAEFRKQLNRKYNVSFDNLFAITNLPVSRFLDYLIQSGNYEEYMEKLVNAFNPAAAEAVMCRSTISVGWDGKLYDCDFNQMLDLEVDLGQDSNVEGTGSHLNQWNTNALLDRQIILNQHCYGCTAGAGSSCGGSIAE